MSKEDCSDEAGALLAFWFGDAEDAEQVAARRKFWFSPSAEQDRELRERFAALHERAQRGELDHWVGEPRQTLALVLLLDQLTRNLYRGSARAFANDARALAICLDGTARGMEVALGVVERTFWYLPLQHSEKLEDQRHSVRRFRALLEDSPAPFRAFAKNSYDFAVLHCEIIERFGRFPHRNELLGRPSTGMEREYLASGGHRFGQG